MMYGNLFDPFTGQEMIDDCGKHLFLQSPAYCSMIRKMVVGITGDHTLTVHILPVSDPELAYTDSKRVFINTLHPEFIMEPIEKITIYCLALAVHESLHPLYTCFQCIKDACRKRASENENIVYVRKSIYNILEDGRIERIGRYKFPGVAYAIDELNQFLYHEDKDLSQLKEIELMMQWLLDFSSVRRNRDDGLSDELNSLWEKIKPIALRAINSDSSIECYRCSKEILKYVKHLIPDDEPLNNQQQKPENCNGNDTDVDANTDQGGSNGSRPSQSNSNSNGKGNQKGKKSSGKATDDSGQSNGNGSGKGNQQNQSDSMSGGSDSKDGKSDDGSNNGDGNDSQGQSSSDNSSGQKAGGSGGNALLEPITKEEAEAQAREISEMLQNAINASYREHQADQANDKQDGKTVNSLKAESDGSFKIEPHFGSFNQLDDYERFKEPLLPIVRSLKTGLKNILNYNVDEVSRYLHSGRIDGKSLSRIPSGAVCAKRIEKNDEADLNITVMVDLSGSMQGPTILYAKAACIVLREVCKELNIPISVMGFRSGRPTSICQFANSEMKGRYSHTGIVDMSASGSTPLNAALTYLPKHIKRQSQADKLVIVITDGEPDEMPEVCRSSVKVLEKDAKVYGLAIGCGWEALAKIFGDKFIGIDTIEQLPRELCKVIEKNLFRR